MRSIAALVLTLVSITIFVRAYENLCGGKVLAFSIGALIGLILLYIGYRIFLKTLSKS